MTGGSVLEREHELASSDELVAAVAAGAGGTVVIEGQPGLGKSTVLAETSRRATGRRELMVLEFRCGELEQKLAWAAARGLLGQAVSDVAPATRRHLFAGCASPAATVLDPVAQRDDRREEDVFAAVHAVFSLIRRIAERRPVLLVLDDAHWCDEQSLHLLAYLQRRLRALPIGLVVSMRPASCCRRQGFLAALQAGPDTEVHRLAPLGADSVAALVRTRDFPEASATLCGACWEVTAGNPFYLHELLIELRHQGVRSDGAPERVWQVTPPPVLTALLLRLDRLDAPEAISLARAAAILGDGAALRHAAALAEVSEREAVDALDALSAAQLLAPGEPLRFLHPIVRTAIYSDIPAAWRSQQHARAAVLLAHEQVSADKVALHVLEAPRAGSPAAVAVLREAAASARAQGAPRSAVRCLRRALEEPPSAEKRVDLLVELARVELAVGDAACVRHLSEALGLACDERRRAAILLELGWSQHHAADFRSAADAFERGLGVARRLDDPGLAAQLEAGCLVSAMLDFRQVAAAVARIEALQARAPELQKPAHRMLLAQVLSTRSASGAPREQVIELAQQIWSGGQLLRDEGSESQALWQVVAALSCADAYEPALTAIDLALEDADKRGLALAHASARLARAAPNYWMARVPEAARDAWAAIEIWNGGLETHLPAAVYWFGLACLELDDAAAAERARELAGSAERWQQTGMMSFIHSLNGHLELRGGRPQAAVAAFEACGTVMEALLIRNPAVIPWRSYAAQALLMLGDRRRARLLAQEELELARAIGAPRAVGVALRTCGLSASGAAGIRLLREAVAEQARSGATLELARTLIDLGAAIRRAGKRRPARPHLQAGLELAQAGGAIVLARRAETELRAAGGRARRATDTGPGMLTASERRVAELAARGHSNRTIAGLLHVSIKAVEWHLHQSYRKLNIDGRRQLDAALAPACAHRPAPAFADRIAGAGGGQLFLPGAVPKTWSQNGALTP